MSEFRIYKAQRPNSQNSRANDTYADMAIGSEYGGISIVGLVMDGAFFNLFVHVGDIISDDIPDTRNNISIGTVVFDVAENRLWFYDYAGWVDVSEARSCFFDCVNNTDNQVPVAQS